MHAVLSFLLENFLICGQDFEEIFCVGLAGKGKEIQAKSLQ